MIKVLSHYNFGAEVEEVRPFGNGNINKTYLINTANNQKFILQEINTKVFKKPKDVMRNIELVTNHIRNIHQMNHMDSDNAVLEIFYSIEKESYVKENNRFWRAYKYVNNAITHETTDDPELFQQVGVAIGAFQKFLNDFDPKKLAVTIPDFHHTPKRFEALKKVVEEDRYDRAMRVYEELKFIEDRYELLKVITEALDNEEIPLRVTHNDTKLNNVMIDTSTKKAVCIIDLDTVMPGSILYDFGDAVRIGASEAKEDEIDLTKVKLNLDLFKAFAEGFLFETASILTAKEEELLVDSVWLITMEITIRFLTDYLNNDQYFRIDYPEHNLVRVKAQMQLAKDIEANKIKMKQIVNNILKNKSMSR
jgi:N-acetylhexosamine 1-kinase